MKVLIILTIIFLMASFVFGFGAFLASDPDLEPRYKKLLFVIWVSFITTITALGIWSICK